MRIFRIRLKKEYRLKVWSVILSVFIIGYFLIPKANRMMMMTFFNTKCRNYYFQVVYSKKLNDRIADYSFQARNNGIAPCKNEEEIRKQVRKWKLFRVRSSSLYIVADMNNSYPYITRDSKALINEIGKRFKKQIAEYGLKGSKFYVTSMTRTTDNMKGLKKTNGNVSDNSPHLNGNAFDISYARFSFRKLFVTSCDEWYLKEALAEVIWQLRDEKKCWATYEKQQGCYHIVAR
jgi:predicted nucleic acid-binding Zn ribbon protein